MPLVNVIRKNFYLLEATILIGWGILLATVVFSMGCELGAPICDGDHAAPFAMFAVFAPLYFWFTVRSVFEFSWKLGPLKWLTVIGPILLWMLDAHAWLVVRRWYTGETAIPYVLSRYQRRANSTPTGAPQPTNSTVSRASEPASSASWIRHRVHLVLLGVIVLLAMYCVVLSREVRILEAAKTSGASAVRKVSPLEKLNEVPLEKDRLSRP